MKTDTSIRNICLAAAKRKVIKPFDSKFTTIFETDTMAEIGSLIYFLPPPEENELPICQTFINNNNWTLVTTRRMITCKNGAQNSMRVGEFNVTNWGDVKGIGQTEYTLARVISNLNENLEIFIETGFAAMIMVSVLDFLSNIA